MKFTGPLLLIAAIFTINGAVPLALLHLAKAINLALFPQ